MSTTNPRDVYDAIGADVATFLTTECGDEVDALATDDDKAWCWVDWAAVRDWEPHVAASLREEYPVYRTVFEWALEDETDAADPEVWVHNLPGAVTRGVGGYRSVDVGEFVSVRGQISKVGQVKFDPDEIAFECELCGTLNYIPQPDNDISEPHQCNACDRNESWSINSGQTELHDRVMLQLTQPVEEVADGNGASIPVVLRDNVEAWFAERGLSSGARITINGTLELDTHTDAERGAFKVYLRADSIEVEEQQYEAIDTTEHIERIEELAAADDVYEKLIGSLAPDIQGGEKLADIKLAIILQQFGGYRRDKPDGTTIRGDSHVLLIGDPSTGKSSLLNAVTNIAPRAVTASGKGASAAGMTAAAIKDDFGDGQFSLEAGALALANGGVAAIDEIGRMQPDAVSSMHDALETQVISVNKAGINAQIPARTAVLAAGNPENDRFDNYEPIYQQIDLDPALWSRFDVAYILRDHVDEERDERIAAGKTKVWRESAKVDRGELDPEDAETITPEIDHEVLRAYIAHAKRTVKPVLTEAASEAIVEFYTEIRSKGTDDTPALAARKLEGIRRFAEAAARVRLSEAVTTDHVETAKRVIGRSLADVGVNEEGELDANIVETGTSTPQRKRVKNLKALIADIADGDEYPDGAPLDDVVERAVETFGMDVGRVEHELDKLKQKGEVYEPSTGKLRPS